MVYLRFRYCAVGNWWWWTLHLLVILQFVFLNIKRRQYQNISNNLKLFNDSSNDFVHLLLYYLLSYWRRGAQLLQTITEFLDKDSSFFIYHISQFNIDLFLWYTSIAWKSYTLQMPFIVVIALSFEYFNR